MKAIQNPTMRKAATILLIVALSCTPAIVVTALTNNGKTTGRQQASGQDGGVQVALVDELPAAENEEAVEAAEEAASTDGDASAEGSQSGLTNADDYYGAETDGYGYGDTLDSMDLNSLLADLGGSWDDIDWSEYDAEDGDYDWSQEDLDVATSDVDADDTTEVVTAADNPASQVSAPAVSDEDVVDDETAALSYTADEMKDTADSDEAKKDQAKQEAQAKVKAKAEREAREKAEAKAKAEQEAREKAEAEAKAKAEQRKAELKARIVQIKNQNIENVAKLPNLTDEQRTELVKLYNKRDILALQNKTLPEESIQRISELEAHAK